MNTQTDAEVINLCQSAFHAEYYRQFDKAYELHGQAIQGLNRVINDASFFDRDRKRVAKKQLKFHTSRQQVIRPLKDGNQTQLPIILPTSVSAREELLAMGSSGVMPISLEELWLAKYLKDKETTPNLVPDPAMQHLLQNPVPFYTPTLDPRLPPYSFHVYVGADPAFTQQIIYFKAKSAGDDKIPGSERQTLYVLQARKRPRYQIPLTTFHRSSEFTTPCIQVAVTGVKMGYSKYDTMLKGRPMQFYTSTPRVIREEPDRLDKKGWGPRRFTYGGRQFAWVTESNDEGMPQSLYEIESVWPKPGSKTGKKEHKVVGRKLAWGENKMALKKLCVLHIAGGTDQLFREYILASQLTRLAIMFHGHD